MTTKFTMEDGSEYSVDEEIYDIERKAFYEYVNLRINRIMYHYATQGKSKEEIRDLADTEINTFLMCANEDRFAEFKFDEDPDNPERKIISFRLVHVKVV